MLLTEEEKCIKGFSILKQFQADADIKKVFNENMTLMELVDIRNEYELHNFLKKTNRVDNIKYSNMPKIKIGEANYLEQIKLLMSKHSEIDKHEFSKIIESEYGIKQETFLGSMQEEIKKSSKSHLMLKLNLRASLTFSNVISSILPIFSFSLTLSKVLTCSTRIIESFSNPQLPALIGI